MRSISLLFTLLLFLVAPQAEAMSFVITLVPDAPMTRVAFVERVLSVVQPHADLKHCVLSDARYSLLFTDVHVTDAHAGSLCTAMRSGLIDGYADGSFRPGANINVAEAAKIIAKAYALPLNVHPQRQETWFSPYVFALQKAGALPPALHSYDSFVMRSDLDVMLTPLTPPPTVWTQSSLK